jgi:two-component system sensor histidine kinase BaeS
LRQALDNLVANALVHSGSVDEVVVRALHGEASILISVVDAGAGVPLAEQERIFQPGVRLDGERPGSGIGLAVARAVAEAHGGSLTVESAPDEGATFTLQVPVG